MTDLLSMIDDPEPERFHRRSECSVDGCDRLVLARSLCGAHYKRMTDGRPLDGPIRKSARGSISDRLWARVDKIEDGCWLWTAGTDRHGYGVIGSGGRGGRNLYVHRVAYELLVGPIPGGLQIDHLCRTPLCVRPDHLEPVTQAENILRGESAPARNARKTHCDQGHEFTPANTISVSGGGRGCRTCKQQRDRERYWLQRAAAA